MRPRDFTLTSNGPLRLYSTAELLGFAPPTYLIDKLLPQGGLVGLYGLPGAAKTFLAIDLALHVAMGLPWLGRATAPGNVLYVRLPVFGYYDEQGNLVGEQTIIATMSGLSASKMRCPAPRYCWTRTREGCTDGPGRAWSTIS